MDISKSLYQAPIGIEDIIPNDEPAIEIEIENPDSVTIGIDGMEISMMPVEEEFDANLAENMDGG